MIGSICAVKGCYFFVSYIFICFIIHYAASPNSLKQFMITYSVLEDFVRKKQNRPRRTCSIVLKISSSENCSHCRIRNRCFRHRSRRSTGSRSTIRSCCRRQRIRCRIRHSHRYIRSHCRRRCCQSRIRHRFRYHRNLIKEESK